MTRENHAGQANIKDLVRCAVDRLEDLCGNAETISGISTGFQDLDSTINGICPGEVFAIGSRPAMGKTAFAVNIVEHVALGCRQNVAVFNLDISPEHWVLRMLCSAARIKVNYFRQGSLTKNEISRIAHVARQMSDCRIFVDGRCGLSIGELESTARRLASEAALDIIVIDNFLNMRSRLDQDRENRRADYSKILDGINQLAKELGVAIVLFTGLNRNTENRSDKRPRIRDLHQSSLLERHADLIGLLWRAAYYAEDEEERESAGGYAELIVAKNSRGLFGVVPLIFDPDCVRFADSALP